MTISVEVWDRGQACPGASARNESDTMRHEHIYRTTLEAAHDVADAYRAMGLSVTTPAITISGSYVVIVAHPIAGEWS